MNQAELQTSSEGYSIATVGDLASFEGKAFVKDILNTTSMEVSFGTLAPGCTVPFSSSQNHNTLLNGTLHQKFYDTQTFKIIYFSSIYMLYEWVKSSGFLGRPWCHRKYHPARHHPG